MEVIKHGNTYKEKECPGCGALLSYGNADIITIEEKEVFGECRWCNWHVRKYIICPECKKQIDISWIVDGKETMK